MDHVDSPSNPIRPMRVSCFGEYFYEKSDDSGKSLRISYGYDELKNEGDLLLRDGRGAHRKFEATHVRLSIPLLDACSLWWEIKGGCSDAEASILWEVIEFGDLFVTILTDICYSTPNALVSRAQQRLDDGKPPSMSPELVSLENAYHFVLSLLPSQLTEDLPSLDGNDAINVHSSNYRLIENASIFIKKLALLVVLFGNRQSERSEEEKDAHRKKQNIQYEPCVTEHEFSECCEKNRQRLKKAILSTRSSDDRSSFAGHCITHSRLVVCRCPPTATCDAFSPPDSLPGQALSYLHPYEPIMHDLIDQPSLKFLNFLQNLLFFGPMEALFGFVDMEFDVDQYRMRGSNGRVFVKTDRLAVDLAIWQTKVRNLDNTDEVKSKGIRAFLAKCRSEVKFLDQPGSPVVSSGLVLSTQILLESFSQSILGPSRGAHVNASLLLGDELVSMGRCPLQAASASACYDILTRYYIYLLGPPIQSHAGNHWHDICSMAHCIQNNLDERTYQQKHVFQDRAVCTCQILSPLFGSYAALEGFIQPMFRRMQSQTIAILESGGIPVVSIPVVSITHSKLRLGQVTDIQVVESKPDTKYVAISHVWSDGLGNPNDNTILLCQLTNLQSMLAQSRFFPETPESDGRINFWLDTLCVPVPPASLPEERKIPWTRSRKQAISRMRDVYSNAICTLVLDAELMRTPIPSSESEQARAVEYFTRLMISTWNFRMWTFSEASLNLFCVQFKDELFDPFQTLRRFIEDEDFLDRVLGCRETPWVYSGFGRRRQPSDTDRDGRRVDRFLRCWAGIRWRTTSKRKDQMICVSALLGLDIIQILESEDEQNQYRTMLALQRRFASKILFCIGPRLRDPGFRWAPESLLGNPYHQIGWTTDALSTFELGRGLKGRHPGIILREFPYLSLDREDMEKNDFNLDIDGVDEEGVLFYMCLKAPSCYNFLDDYPQDGLESLALIFEHPISYWQEHDVEIDYAVLVAIRGPFSGTGIVSDRCIETLFIASVLVGRADLKIIGWEAGDSDPLRWDDRPIVECQCTAIDQIWCVG